MIVTIVFQTVDNPSMPEQAGEDDTLHGLGPKEGVHEALCRAIHEGDADAYEWLDANIMNISKQETHQMPLSEQAIKELREVKEYILTEPRRLNMSFHLQHRPENGDSNYFLRDGYCDSFRQTEWPACETVGCIAGWYCFLNKEDKEPSDELWGWQERAMSRRLGVNAFRLFYPERWPDDLRDRYRHHVTNPMEKAQVTADAIERFIEDPEEFGN